MNQKLLFARAYEREASRQIPEMARPKFHLSPCTGWMNDPNGFSFYKGEYHLFYQYNPYDTCWDTMHWGHAVSGDLLSWRYLPAAMAPNEWYDADGCWSGSAMEMPDGRQLLMYTGNRRESRATRENLQVQCLALGDGIDYEKYAGNPVLTAADLPDECSPYDFRDPSIWRESDGTYRAIVGTCTKERLGKLLLFSSEDGLRWRFESVFAENDGRLGLMWECPDFFMLDGKAVLLVSPQDMLPQDFEYHNGNGTVAFIGHLEDDGKRFVPETDHAVDYGIDFYAPTTILTPDGRRVMIGWMQNWDACQNAGRKDLLWYGQMSLPRELFLRSGRLYQRPIRELEEAAGCPMKTSGWMANCAFPASRVAWWTWRSPFAPPRDVSIISLRYDSWRTSGSSPSSAIAPMNPSCGSTASSPVPAVPISISAGRWCPIGAAS